MAVANGRTGPAVIQRLFGEPYRFDFFQAVRLLDSHARGVDEAHRRWPVGHDATPVQEMVRFGLPLRSRFRPVRSWGWPRPTAMSMARIRRK